MIIEDSKKIEKKDIMHCQQHNRSYDNNKNALPLIYKGSSTFVSYGDLCSYRKKTKNY